MRLSTVLLISLIAACVHTKKPEAPPAPVLEIPTIPHSPSAPVSPGADLPDSEDTTRHFTYVDQDNYLFVKFDPKLLPPGTFFIEATYGDEYLGYFVLGDVIVLKKPDKGSKVLLYYVLDGRGNRMLAEPHTAILP